VTHSPQFCAVTQPISHSDSPSNETLARDCHRFSVLGVQIETAVAQSNQKGCTWSLGVCYVCFSNNIWVILGDTMVILGDTRVILGDTRVILGDTRVILVDTR
jgi:hypothetical protein